MDVLSELILESLLGESMTQRQESKLFGEIIIDKSLPTNALRINGQLFLIGPSTPGKRNIPPNQSTFDYLMYGETFSTPDQESITIDPMLVTPPSDTWHKFNRPQCVSKELAQAKYGKDHGEKITIGEIVDQLRQLPNGNEFRDKVDELFFDGAWPNDDSGQKICETFKRDIAGILHSALHKQDNSAKWEGFVPVPKEEINKLVKEHALYESRFRRLKVLIEKARSEGQVTQTQYTLFEAMRVLLRDIEL